MEIFIYLLGFVVAYLFIKWGRKKMEMKHNWEMIFFSVILSCFSWGTVIALCFVSLIVYTQKTTFPNPPKWL